MNPFFSVCIPNFNYDKYVGETIESVLSQTFADFEIIVVDNASTDTSWLVIQEYAKQDSRIRAFRNHCNIGFAPNLQRATEKAAGDFIFLLSSDDVMYPTALQEYFNVIAAHKESHHSIVLHAAFSQIDSEGKFVKLGYNVPDSFKIHYGKDASLLDANNVSFIKQQPLAALRFALEHNYGIAAFMTTCYSRALWLKIEGYDTQYQIFPDKAFLFKMLLLKPTYIYINANLFGYRVHASNQNSQDLNNATLKHQYDGYLRSVSLTGDALTKIGLTRDVVQKKFVRNLCALHGLIAMKGNLRLKAFRIVCYAYSAYPRLAVKDAYIWGLKGLLLLGPLGHYLVVAIYRGSKS